MEMITTTELLDFLCKAQKLSILDVTFTQTDEGYKITLRDDWYGDDFSEENRYVPVNSKQYRAVRAFHEQFGTWYLHGLRFISKEDFFSEYSYYIPPVMMKLSNKGCYKDFHTRVHYNFS